MKLRALKAAAASAVIIAGAFAFVRWQYEVPVLMYHRVSAGELSTAPNVTPHTFERQMQFLRLHGYKVVPLKELARLVRSGKPVPFSTVAITFDDGTLDNFQNAFPVLRDLELPATIFVIVRNLNTAGWLSDEDLRVLDDGGVAIGSHTVSHAFLPNLSDAAQMHREIADSQDALETVLGHPVTLFSYPAGGVTDEARAFVQETGYEAAVTTNYGSARHDPLALHRIKITEADANLFRFWVKLSGLYQMGKKREPIR